MNRLICEKASTHTATKAAQSLTRVTNAFRDADNERQSDGERDGGGGQKNRKKYGKQTGRKGDRKGEKERKRRLTDLNLKWTSGDIRKRKEKV